MAEDKIIMRSMYIEEGVYKALKKHCKENGLTVTGIIRVLIKRYLAEEEQNGHTSK